LSEATQAPQVREPRRIDGPVAGIILVHLVFALVLSYAMALGYAPDEPRHYAYVRWLAENHSFPPPDERLSGGAHSLHPPLYYTLMLPLYWAFHGLGDAAAMRAMRCVAPVFGALALWLLVPVVRQASGGRRGLMLFMLALIALWPQLSVCVAMVNNDAASVLMAAVLLNVMLVRRWDQRRSTAAVWGAVLGLAALAKFSNFIAGAPAVAVALAVVHGKGFYRREEFWKAGFIAGISCLAVCGWWWYRNLLVYGAVNPYPAVPVLPAGLSSLDAVLYGYAWRLFLRAVNGLWASTWPVIGWAPDVLMPLILAVLRALTALAVVGFGMWLWRMWRTRGQGQGLPAVAVAAAAYGAMLLTLLYVATFKHAGTYQNGRYLMPFLAGLVSPLALAWREICPARARVAAGIAVLLFFVFLNGAAWYHLVTYWNPLVLGRK
jgi:hypothetical protein